MRCQPINTTNMWGECGASVGRVWGECGASVEQMSAVCSVVVDIEDISIIKRIKVYTLDLSFSVYHSFVLLNVLRYMLYI